MRGLPYDRNQLFLNTVLKVSPDWFRMGITRCRPVPRHTMIMAGKVCFSCVFKKKNSSPTKSLNTKEVGKRLTIGKAGRFLCLTSNTLVPGGCQDEPALGSTET